MSSVAEILNSKQSIKQKKHTVYSKQYGERSILETRQFVEQLDRRLYVNEKFLPFYCKAARALGFARVLELQAMVLQDPRIDTPAVFNAERVFWSLLRKDLNLKQKTQGA